MQFPRLEIADGEESVLQDLLRWSECQSEAIKVKRDNGSSTNLSRWKNMQTNVAYELQRICLLCLETSKSGPWSCVIAVYCLWLLQLGDGVMRWSLCVAVVVDVCVCVCIMLKNWRRRGAPFYAISGRQMHRTCAQLHNLSHLICKEGAPSLTERITCNKILR